MDTDFFSRQLLSYTTAINMYLLFNVDITLGESVQLENLIRKLGILSTGQPVHCREATCGRG